LGWLGSNPGSTTVANKDITMIFVNNNLAAAIVQPISQFKPIRQTYGS
jgi:ammonia channel protein AmtB